MIPYGHQSISEADVQAVISTLRSDWITQGPTVERFERAVAEFCGVAHAVAVSSGTAALHAAMAAVGVGPGDEVIVPAMTFVATANCVVYQGATPVFADVGRNDLLMDLASVETLITPRTRAIVAVDYAGQPCNYTALREIAKRHGLVLVADASHSLGATDGGRPVGAMADLTTFSFHPVKPITTGEGGMIVTDDETLAARMRAFRGHGIDRDVQSRSRDGEWRYDMGELGFNYRLTDIQAALGLTQLASLPYWIGRRQEIARRYDHVFAAIEGVQPLARRADVVHGYHLYVVRLDEAAVGLSRAAMFKALRNHGIGVNVHYLPVYWHSYYRDRYGYEAGLCPVAEVAYEEILSLPIYPELSDNGVDRVIAAVEDIVQGGVKQCHAS